ncbi:hypothetical protein CC78DRAFT_621300 [Lojkania enalia]|uniref:Uncharacterized protein n=1 Tax=Lojkania enalia TaxID=147567 RepID=A0A9P4K1S9_9PLEO|nr:hypothetical protein CC78DRAFT_621300 [Didymosphaeria enalia]
MAFTEQDLDEAIDFKNASNTPHRVYGKGQMVYWKSCKTTLMKIGVDDLEFLRDIKMHDGKGKLDFGLALVFGTLGGNKVGMVKEGPYI